MAMKRRRAVPGIQYAGLPGISRECQYAVMRFIQYGDRIERARILTYKPRDGGVDHSLLLTVEGDPVIVNTGFSSGYGGTGPHAFSITLGLLHSHGAEIDEIEVSVELHQRIEAAALSSADLRRIERATEIRPSRWSDYIQESHWGDGIDDPGLRQLWRYFPSVIPFSLIDERINDLAMTFHTNEDHNLLIGYRRLESVIRGRTGLIEHGRELFTKAFSLPKPKLRWRNVAPAEQAGRMELFRSIYATYRNPRAHRVGKQHKSQLGEFLLLNQLFLLEAEAVGGRRKKVPSSRIERLLAAASEV